MICKMATKIKVGLSLLLVVAMVMYVTHGSVAVKSAIPTSEEQCSSDDCPEAKKLKDDSHTVSDDQSTKDADKLEAAHGDESLKVDVKHDMVNESSKTEDKESVSANRSPPPIHLGVVCCGDRLPEVIVMLKSARLFSARKLQFHIFAETDLHQEFKRQLGAWPADVLKTVEYKIYPITFPKGQNAETWKKLFKPCATQRLFIPDLLTDVDALLYMDTDTLFMRPVEDVWAHFKKFNSTQLAALAPEHEDKATSWYGRFARHPYYPPLGVNSGVMLMNLTMMREQKWSQHMINYYQEYKLKITWGDQDLINIYFSFFPERLYVYPCHWNYRPDHCMYGSACKSAETEGTFVLHGCRSVFHNEKQPAFKAVYQTFRDFEFSEDLKLLTKRANNAYETTGSTYCGRVPEIFFRQLKKTVATVKKRKK